jgi:hypothetical protein
MRVAGYDVMVTEAATGVKRLNWASNANGHVMPAFFSMRGIMSTYTVDVNDIVQRDNFWVELPIFSSTTTFSIKLESAGFKIISDGKEQSSIGFGPILTTVDDVPRSGDGYVGEIKYEEVKVKVDSEIQYYLDFRLHTEPDSVILLKSLLSL